MTKYSLIKTVTSFAFLISLLATILPAQATSLHPCTPTERAPAPPLSCKSGNLAYDIQFTRLVSRDLPMCQDENRRFYMTAYVSVRDRSTQSPLGQITLFDGTFTINAGPGDGFSFYSAPFQLELRDCTAPMTGGASVGNLPQTE